MVNEYDWEKEVLHEREWKRRKRLREEFHGSGPVAFAFERMCKAGCNADWLEKELIYLADRFPFRRTRAMLPAAARKKFDQIIRGLEVTADRLLEILDQPGPVAIFAKVEEKEWPVPWPELPNVLKTIADNLRVSLSSPRWHHRRWANPAGHRIPFLMEKVRRQTGRAHYADMATLFAAAYRRPYYTDRWTGSKLRTLTADKNLKEIICS